MSTEEIIINILTSSAVVGFAVTLATIYIQKRVDTRFDQISEFQKTLISIRKDRYDTVLKTLQEIWEKLVETEYYIRHDLVAQLEDSKAAGNTHLKLNSKPLKDAFIFIEKRSILLDKELSTKVQDLFINHLQTTFNGFITILNEGSAGRKSIMEVNNFIPNSLGSNYKKELDELKAMFEESARKILHD